MVKPIRQHIANGITLLNLFFGCIAIVNAFGGRFQDLETAGYYIFFAAIADFLDGFVARFLKSTSDLGKQLDSLSDVVSFGVAPSIIAFQLLNYNLFHANLIDAPEKYFCFFAFIVAVSAAYRLGKFNIDDTQTTHFSGVPTPATGLAIASIPMMIVDNDYPFLFKHLFSVEIFSLLLLFFALMMNLRLPILSLKFSKGGIGKNIDKVLLVLVGLVIFILLDKSSGIFIYFWYVGFSLCSFYIMPKLFPNSK